MADCYLIGRGLDIFDHDEAEVQAGRAIEKAIELDDAVAEAHASRGLMLRDDFRFTEAEAEFKRALSLNQSYASAHHWYSICLSDMGSLEEGMEEAKLAALSDPLAPLRGTSWV